MKKLYSLFVGSAGRLASLAALSVSALYVNIAQAQTPLSDLRVNNIQQNLFCPIYNLMFNIVVVVSVIMVLWAAFTYVTGGDDAEKISKAHKMLTYAAIGVAVAIVAGGFPYLVGSIFGSSGAVSFVCPWTAL